MKHVRVNQTTQCLGPDRLEFHRHCKKFFRSPETNRAMSVSSMNTFIPTDRGFLQSSLAIGRSVPSLQPQMMGPYDLGVDENKEREILMESRQLRVHQQRLEQRSKILEDQNRQLETQLKRLQKLVERVSYGVKK